MTDTVNTDEINFTARSGEVDAEQAGISEAAEAAENVTAGNKTEDITGSAATAAENIVKSGENSAVTAPKPADPSADQTGIGAPETVSGKLSPALKKEIRNIFIYVFIGVALLILVFFLINLFVDEPADYVKFDYTVVLGALGGGLVAWGNFFLMGLTVQKVASDINEERARNRMKLSYTYRYLMQIAWIVIAILVPCFNFITGIIPLLFPTLGIKIAGIIFKKY